jgi:hypothetical protein
MENLSKERIFEIYDNVSQYHKRYLAQFGVELPGLRRGGNFTKSALALVYLAKDYPNTQIISKGELTEFIRQFYPDTTDVQQARHLGAQKGWYILSGTRGDNASASLQSGDYKLETLERPYPGFTAARREETIDADYWEQLKAKYDYRCACCGSKEGAPHRYWKNTTTVLQKGHMDPNKPLKPGNIIPQCEKCNRPDRNYWVYDKKGRVVKIANAKVIDACSKRVKLEMYEKHS